MRLFLWLTLPLIASAAAAADRPNVVLIMADDMGFSDLGCYGGEIRTPNLDALAEDGLRFTQFYNTARCCPTRAALLTGIHQHQAGIGHMVNDRGHPSYQGYLNDRCVTIAEALKPAGYATFLSGKWHVGEQRPHWPDKRGFDRSYALISGATNFFRLDRGRSMAIDGKPYTPPEDWYITDAISDNAVSYIEKHDRDDPFFLYVPYTAPHWPLHALPEDIERYRGKYMIGWDEIRERRFARMSEMGLIDPNWGLTPRDPKVVAWDKFGQKDEYDLRMAVYAAQIDRMDQGIGAIVAALKKAGRFDNTLILFLADNGGCAEVIDRSDDKNAPTGVADSYRSYGIGWANASNTPFRLYKHWVHEGGIATPLIAHWPAGLKAERGSITHETGQLVDLMATCLDLAGAEYPERSNGKPLVPMQGKSLRPILEGKRWPEPRTLYWEHEGNRAVRKGDWKLVSRHPGNWELYDLKSDRTEMNDLASEQPDRVAELRAVYDEWAERAGVLPWAKINRRR